MDTNRGFLSRVVVVLMVGGLFAGPAAAQGRGFTSGDHCTYGDAMMVGQSFYPLGSAPGAPDSRWICQFRSFYTPPEGYCFCDRDVVFGGDTWSWWFTPPRPDYILELIHDWRLVERVATVTPADVIQVTPISTPLAGLRPYVTEEGERFYAKRTQFGVLLSDLVPGTYDVTIRYSHPDIGEFSSEHSFVQILPHSEAHDHGLGPVWGTVTCPPWERACDNGVDDDGDGQIDCDDSQCTRNVWGEYEGTDEPCFTGSYAELGDDLTAPLWQGSTVGTSDDWVFLFDPTPPEEALDDDSCNWTGSGWGAPDTAAHWTVPQSGTYTFDFAFPTELEASFLFGVSTGAKRWCNQGPIPGVSLDEGDVVTIVMDGINVWDQAPFDLYATRTGD